MIVYGLAALALNLAFGNQIDPKTTEFPWKNAATSDAVYRLADHPNVVHVLEAWTLTCGGCSENAASVAELAAEYDGDARVQFIDMGLDPAARDYTRWIEAHHPEHPVVQDVNRRVFDQLRHADTVPQAFIVDCKGSLTSWASGHWSDDVKGTIRSGIAKALAVRCD